MIFVSHCPARHLKQLRNGIPVKEFSGNKKDYSLVALSRYALLINFDRYLKGFVRIKDVREKLQTDFKTPDL